MIFNDQQLHEFFFKSERRTDWNVEKQQYLFEKELHRQKDSPSKRPVNKILVLNLIHGLTLIRWLTSVVCVSLVSDSENFRGLFSCLTLAKIFQRKQKMTSFDRSIPIKFHATFQDTVMFLICWYLRVSPSQLQEGPGSWLI